MAPKSEAQKAWQAANQEKVREYRRRWVEKNKEKQLSLVREWKAKNPDKVKSYTTPYSAEKYAANRDKYISQVAARAARRRGLYVETVYRRRVWERDEGICHLCGALADAENWHMEHVIPLILGGPHCHDNVAVSHPSCNGSKGSGAGSPNTEIDARARAAYLAFHGVEFE